MLLGLCLLGRAGPAAAEGVPPLDARLEEERRRTLDLTIEKSGPLDYDYGGWIRSEFIRYDDEPYKDTRTLRFYDLRLWGSARVADVHRFYARVLFQYIDFNSGDQYGLHENEWRAARLDQGFYEVDLSGPGSALGATALTGRAGRQFFQVGRGLALNATMDGLVVEGRGSLLGVKLLGARTITSTDDIDHSRPESGDSHRLFYGAEVSLLTFARYQAYALGLVQRDLNTAIHDEPGENFKYDSEYWGFGVRVEPLPYLRLRGEFIYETGQSHPDPATVTDGAAKGEEIRAQSLDLLAELWPSLPWNLRCSAEYLWGSGDADRGSVTNTVGGNVSGTDDRGFLAFGYQNAGLALFPRISNLHVFRFGVAASPLAEPSSFGTLDVAVDVFCYRKAKAAGAISDLRADLQNADVGWELDVSVIWRLLSDLMIEARYGRFAPGNAYSGATDQDRNFLSLSLTYMF
jgi:hypothetical protein